MSAERGRTITSVTPVSLREQRVGVRQEYCGGEESAAWPLRSRGGRPASRRQQPRAEEHDDEDGAEHERQPGEPEGEEAEGRLAGVDGDLGDEHVDGGAGEHEQRPGVRAEGQRDRATATASWRRRMASNDDHRQQRRDGPVDADERGHDGDEGHEQATRRAGVPSRAVDELLPGPRRDAGGVEARR